MKYLVIASTFLFSANLFAGPITCESLDENVNGGNFKFVINEKMELPGEDGRLMTMFPIQASNVAADAHKNFSGLGEASADGIDLTLVTEGDIAQGYLTATARESADGNIVLLDGYVLADGITDGMEIPVMCMMSK